MRWALGIVCCFLFFAKSLCAAEFIEIDHIKVQDLQDIYAFYNYNGEKGYLMIPSYHYPPIFLRHFPDDFASITNEAERHALFIKILAPLALRLNNEIIAERREIIALDQAFKQNQELSPQQEQWLEDKAAEYDVFSRLKGHRRYTYLLGELLQKVHVIPPSVLITAAALETNWGTSRIIKEADSLYKTLEWHTDKGLKPIGETQDDSYRIKIYPNIYNSMQEFAHKLNTALPYQDFRGFRNQILERKTPLLGSSLAPYLVWNSPLKNYAGLFDYTLAYYELNIIDKSVLDSKMISVELPKKLKDKTL